MSATRPTAAALLVLHLSGCVPARPVSLGPFAPPTPEASRIEPPARQPAVSLPQEAVDDGAFWDWVWDQKWYIAVAALIVAAVVVVTWGDDCPPTDQLCQE